jgi:hypothetical protein
LVWGKFVEMYPVIERERVGDENQGGLGPIFPPRALWQPMPRGMLRWRGRCDVGGAGRSCRRGGAPRHGMRGEEDSKLGAVN